MFSALISVLENDDSSSQCSGDSQSSSTASMEVHGLQVSAEYHDKIIKLGQQLWPDDSLKLVGMDNGKGNYHVVGITRTAQSTLEQVRCVIRIPRIADGAERLADGLAAALFVARTSSINIVPDLVTYNLTTENVVGAPYAIHHDLLGVSLDVAWIGLNRESRIAIARQVGAILVNLQRVGYRSAGRLSPSSILEASILQTRHDNPQFLTSNRNDDLPAEVLQNRSPVDFVQLQIAQRRAKDVPDRQHSKIGKWHMLAEVVTQMSNAGMFDDELFYLTHRGLNPSNILVAPADDEMKIVGVLGWEHLVALPSVMGFEPPDWLWRWDVRDNREELDEHHADRPEPNTSDNRVIKAAFDEAVGKEFQRRAYATQHRLARAVIKLAVDGLPSNDENEETDHFGAVGEVVRAWNMLMANHTGRQVFGSSSGDESDKRTRMKQRMKSCTPM